MVSVFHLITNRTTGWLGLLGALLFVACSPDRYSKSTPRISARSGELIYRQDCARCHGDHGQGVAGKYDETLHGEQSVDSLTRYIHRTMPEDRRQKASEPDALAVAQYLHAAFYSPQARLRATSSRLELVRLTNRQFRESIADLVGSFGPMQQAKTGGGLVAEYFQSDGMNKKKKSILKRQDSVVDFDFKNGSPAEDISADQFSIAWTGSLRVPETGEYQFRLTTPNGARLYLNTDLAAGDSNRRDDSDAKREQSLIDLWVSSGGVSRQGIAQAFFLGGRTYPIRLDFFKFKEKTASLRLEWKLPDGPWSIIPAAAFSPEISTVTLVVGTAFPADDRSHGYERGSSISKEWHQAVTKAATETAESIVSRLPRLADIPASVTNPVDRVARMQTFCANFSSRAFRHPLSPSLRTNLMGRTFESGIDPEASVKRWLLFTLTSPRFLYPEAALVDWSDDLNKSLQTASRLGLALWDSLPDATLLEAAKTGTLVTSEQVRVQAERMLQDPRARSKLKDFFHHWLAMSEGGDLAKDPQAYPGFDPLLVADLRESLDQFVEEVVWSPKSDFRELLLADYLFLNRRLAAFYGAQSVEGESFQRVTFEPEKRAGILTHPFLLSTFSYHKSSSPIHRGVFITRTILGRFLKPPPMAIEFMDDRFDPTWTMRQKVTELTGKPTCMACHATINPLGFSLEQFDAVGRFRDRDNAKPVDAQSEYTAADGRVITLKNPRDLAVHAAQSRDARMGFIRQLFQHTLHQSPSAYGSNILQELDADFLKADCNIQTLLVEITVRGALQRVPKKSMNQP